MFATSHVPTIHPILVAKQGMTVDHISGGRFALNVVTGWHKPEIEMFGRRCSSTTSAMPSPRSG